jgi:hypothetical protein
MNSPHNSKVLPALGQVAKRGACLAAHHVAASGSENSGSYLD